MLDRTITSRLPKRLSIMINLKGLRLWAGLVSCLVAVEVRAAETTIELAGKSSMWDMPALAKAPAYHPAADFTAAGVQAIFYAGLPYKGKPTQVFAWLGLPKVPAERKCPAWCSCMAAAERRSTRGSACGSNGVTRRSPWIPAGACPRAAMATGSAPRPAVRPAGAAGTRSMPPRGPMDLSRRRRRDPGPLVAPLAAGRRRRADRLDGHFLGRLFDVHHRRGRSALQVRRAGLRLRLSPTNMGSPHR